MIISPGIPGVLNRLTPNQGSAFRLHFLPVRSIFSVLLSDLFVIPGSGLLKQNMGFKRITAPGNTRKPHALATLGIDSHSTNTRLLIE